MTGPCLASQYCMQFLCGSYRPEKISEHNLLKILPSTLHLIMGAPWNTRGTPQSALVVDQPPHQDSMRGDRHHDRARAQYNGSNSKMQAHGGATLDRSHI